MLGTTPRWTHLRSSALIPRLPRPEGPSAGTESRPEGDV